MRGCPIKNQKFIFLNHPIPHLPPHPNTLSHAHPIHSPTPPHTLLHTPPHLFLPSPIRFPTSSPRPNVLPDAQPIHSPTSSPTSQPTFLHLSHISLTFPYTPTHFSTLPHLPLTSPHPNTFPHSCPHSSLKYCLLLAVQLHLSSPHIEF